ncbi:cytochrome c biogenesis CcdA family protein [Actinomycetaceae bacterium MB13-C1-2]|nr:cytochrome c biogenesis CcdA family protein [Actinomycetaceae bacterium MB13-C1-2]
MDVGLLTAFVGGMLAILSPCAALLLPAFFASTVGSGPRLLIHGVVFYVGLLLVLVPLGVGAGVLGSLFVSHRELIINGASLLLVVFGIMTVFGIGFDASKMLPGSQKLENTTAGSVGLVKSFLLGATSGLAGFCAGPILGAVLTLAAAQGNLVTAGLLLAIYAAGMVVPLLIIALLWNRMGEKGRGRLRGRTFEVFGRRFHSTSVVTGLLMVGVGVLFWATNGLVTMPDLLPGSLSAWLQKNSSILSNVWVDVAAIALVAAILLFVWWRSDRKRDLDSADEGDSPKAPSSIVEVSGVVQPGRDRKN